MNELIEKATLFSVIAGSAICWLVSMIYCARTDWAVMALVSLTFPPVGVIHGLGLLFGWWGAW